MIDSPEDRRRRVQTAILLHGTSREREDAARLLATLILESGAAGAAFGLMSNPRGGRLAPVVSIVASQDPGWDARLSRTVVRVVAREGTSSWCLMIRDVDAAGLAGVTGALIHALGALARCATSKLRPPVPIPPDGDLAAFVIALDAYRLAGFGRASRVEPHRRELRAAIEGRMRGAAGTVLRSLTDPARLASALSELGRDLEDGNHLHEAAATYTVLYELALVERDAIGCMDAARWAGRACRKAAQWSRALRWYGLARRIAEHGGDFERLVRVLDGLGNTYRERGSFPKARQCYKDAWKVAQVAGSPTETANVALGLMTVEREAGRLDSAAAFGWTALGLQSDPAERANLLLNIGTLLREGGDLDAAECAYRVSRALAASADLRLLAADALAYCSALRGDALAYRRLRPRRAAAAPYVRVQLGYFRGAALRALGDGRARRVLSAVERYARALGLSEWEMKSVALRESPLPYSRRVIETPPHVSRGLRELEAALA
jgi:tetratricopeptide (TPR) repeat protein